MPRLDGKTLADRLTRCLDGVDLDPASRRHVVGSMVEASLRGVDSHGIQLFPHYLRALRAGRINGRPKIQIVRKRPSAAVLGADHAFGHHAGTVAVELARELSRETGVGIVAVRNSTHFGAAAYFALQAAREGDIGFAFTNADSLVRAANARGAFFGTNPICMTAPMLNEEPFCLDMATSRISWNRVLIYRREGARLDDGWACDGVGEPTAEPERAEMLEPIGDYKGFGLGMMVEILCGLLAGGPAAKEILPMYRAPIDARRSISHFFAVIRLESFSDANEFKARLGELAAGIRSMTPRPGCSRVVVPGDPEKEAFAARSRDGIPIDRSRLDEFLAIDPAFAEAVLP